MTAVSFLLHWVCTFVAQDLCQVHLCTRMYLRVYWWSLLTNPVNHSQGYTLIGSTLNLFFFGVYACQREWYSACEGGNVYSKSTVFVYLQTCRHRFGFLTSDLRTWIWQRVCLQRFSKTTSICRPDSISHFSSYSFFQVALFFFINILCTASTVAYLFDRIILHYGAHMIKTEAYLLIASLQETW